MRYLLALFSVALLCCVAVAQDQEQPAVAKAYARIGVSGCVPLRLMPGVIKWMDDKSDAIEAMRIPCEKVRQTQVEGKQDPNAYPFTYYVIFKDPMEISKAQELQRLLLDIRSVPGTTKTGVSLIFAEEPFAPSVRQR
jgi:hypothetical protein